MQSRRKQRYTRAEDALAKSLKRYKPEPTAQELQIRALEQVTALLSAHAKDAQERATKLRGVLADDHKETDPQAYAALQRERWMEEKRRSVVDIEAKAVREQIVSLSRFGGKSKTVKEEQRPQMTAEEARQQANLAKFFQLSPTRKPMSSRKKSSPSSYDRAPRRMTMNDAPPMLLRTSIVSTFTPYTQGHTRSVSLDAKPGNRSSTASSRYPNSAPLAVVAEDTNMEQPLITLVQAPSVQPPIPAQPRAHLSTPIAKPRHSSIPLPSDPSPGFATIFPRATPRLRADILAGMEDIEAELPGYALDLIGDLDYIPDHISLRPPDRASDRSRVPPSPPADTGSNESSSLKPHKSRPLQGWTHPPSFLRKSHASSPTKKLRSDPHGPLSNLFAISETSPTTAIPIPIPNPTYPSSADELMTSLPMPVPNGHNQDAATVSTTSSIPRTSTSTASSFEIIHASPQTPHANVQSLPSKPLRQRFTFIGRK